MSYLAILDELQNGRSSYDQTLDKIGRERFRAGHTGSRVRWFSCLNIRIKETGRHGLTLKIPLFFGNAAINLACCARKTRQVLQQSGLSRHQLQQIFRQLKSSDCLFLIDVQAQDGTIVKIHNAGRRQFAAGRPSPGRG